MSSRVAALSTFQTQSKTYWILYRMQNSYQGLFQHLLRRAERRLGPLLLFVERLV